MTDIITITLNPAYDLHYTIDNFRPYKENFVDHALVAAGGKGVNVSRALHLNGKENTAYILMGQDNCTQFEKIIQEEGIHYIPLYVPGKIRENITIHSKDDPETRISFDTFSVDADILTRLYEEMAPKIKQGTLVAFSGRNPRGLQKESVLEFLENLKSLGALLAVDSGSFDIEDLRTLRPWLIKPNEQEIETITHKKVTSLEEGVMAARQLSALSIHHVIVSMGAKGAAYVGCGTAYTAEVPKITPLSTIGAGDSTIAGFLLAYAQGLDGANCLKCALSFGSAACLTEGTQPPRPEDVATIFPDVIVKSQGQETKVKG